MATYGRLPSDFDGLTAMGLAQNIPMIEARNARWIRVAYPYAILPVDMEAPVFEQNQ